MLGGRFPLWLSPRRWVGRFQRVALLSNRKPWHFRRGRRPGTGPEAVRLTAAYKNLDH